MKLLFTLLIALLCLTASAQGLPADPASGKVVYTGAVPVPAGVTPAQAFGRAKVWMASALAGGQVTDDAASGLLSSTGVVPVKDFAYSFRVRLQVEPAAIRYRLEDFTWLHSSDSSAPTRGTAEEQRDSKLSIGKGARAKLLAELDSKVRASLAQLGQEVAGTL